MQALPDVLRCGRAFGVTKHGICMHVISLSPRLWPQHLALRCTTLHDPPEPIKNKKGMAWRARCSSCPERVQVGEVSGFGAGTSVSDAASSYLIRLAAISCRYALVGIAEAASNSHPNGLTQLEPTCTGTSIYWIKTLDIVP